LDSSLILEWFKQHEITLKCFEWPGDKEREEEPPGHPFVLGD